MASVYKVWESELVSTALGLRGCRFRVGAIPRQVQARRLNGWGEGTHARWDKKNRYCKPHCLGP